MKKRAISVIIDYSNRWEHILVSIVFSLERGGIMTEREESMSRRKFTTEECEAKLGELCRGQRNVLTQTQVHEEKDLPSWNTLQSKVGPWYLWGEKFGVPFKDNQRREAAERLRKQAQIEADERLEAEKRFKAKVKAGLVTPTVSVK